LIEKGAEQMLWSNEKKGRQDDEEKHAPPFPKRSQRSKGYTGNRLSRKCKVFLSCLRGNGKLLDKRIDVFRFSINFVARGG
jgi:hypothetical protein